jgi:hypothetical protein
MRKTGWKYMLVFIFGMITFAVGYFLLNVFVGFRRPTPLGTVEDFETICFWYDDQGSIQASISPKGCYSTTCTRQVSKTGSAVLDQDSFKISLNASFVLAETSRFPLPCIENCAGGGMVNLNLGELQVGQYEVWFKDEIVGEFNIYSGLPTPRQCIENPRG